MNKQTPLYKEHMALAAKMCPFAGYDMPINYALGVIKEHEWTRTKAGLFDVSHMGQAIVSGDKAAEFFSRITPSSFIKTPNGRAKYTVLTNEAGGIIDDLIITRMEEKKFFVVFNAGRKDVDIAWMKKNLPSGVSFEELAGNALIALQGPKAESALAKEIPEVNLAALPYMTLAQAKWPPPLHSGAPGNDAAAPKQSEGGKGAPVIISRLGYTGEDGFEISIAADKAAAFWNALLTNPDVQAIGLAARDSLRLEMGYPLYGHDLNEEITPVEASLSWVISKGHSGFIGAEKILKQLESGPAKKRVGVKLLESGIAREGCDIYVDGQTIGSRTSGGFSPSLKLAIGQGYVKSEFTREGQPLDVEVRGKKIPAAVHPLSFMTAQTKPSSLKKAS